jgi:pimeloyl-ACP methyl ester carboxylesterase
MGFIGDAKLAAASNLVIGRVTCDAGCEGSIVVALVSPSGRAVRVAKLEEPGTFELLVQQGTYRLIAFADRNRDLVLDMDEVAVEYAEPVVAHGDGATVRVDLALSPSAIKPTIAVGTSFRDAARTAEAGAIAQLDRPIFCREFGKIGYLQPFRTFDQVGANVYFLEPYDPTKIPVLFVHGATGSAQDWRYFFEHMDRGRYQPWFFTYPSGASLAAMSYALHCKLLDLESKYRFTSIAIVAHSMGGLVVRDLLVEYGALLPAVTVFVSLATPWGGDSFAELSAGAPWVLQSWRDMRPSGSFLQTIFAQRLPSGVDYHLMFSFHGRVSLIRGSNDGTVSVASQLRREAQSDAESVSGFDLDHDGILSSPAVLTEFNAILARKQRAPVPADALAANLGPPRDR